MADNPTSPAAGSHESGGEQSPRSGVREQDRYLPIANISRIMKKALPANGKIAKDAKDTVQECVSEFISFVTSEDSVIRCRTVIGGFGEWGIDCFMKCNGILEMLLLASDKCQKEKRKTINGDDLLWAMATLGFEDYIEPLKVYLARYREQLWQGDAKGSARGGDGSSKRDAVGGLPGQNAQFAFQGSMNYTSPQTWFNYVKDHIWLDDGIVSLSVSVLNGGLEKSLKQSYNLHPNDLALKAQGQHMILPSMPGNE
ncbi:hypothetical protein POTOM_031011 [Populus tomentosa]|uniref:Transcription factor CBF/NF-Y/archaeal histone domain-containing protein n=1 Tax=Populus tomentosa TaxID=118781 RepID=A0A8X7ZHT7_POPTO|nr:hypothetical protein POTOM_031011 [Populus tomentosa]